jgi:hypothetical protein
MANTPRTAAGQEAHQRSHAISREGCPLRRGKPCIIAINIAEAEQQAAEAAAPTPARCDRIVNNGMGEPTECGRTLPCEVHDASTPAEPLNTILQAIVQHCSDANMTFDDLRVLNRLIEKVEQAAAPTPAEPLDVIEAASEMLLWIDTDDQRVCLSSKAADRPEADHD